MAVASRPPTPLEAGTALLARRDYASGELRAKLIDKGHEPSEVDAVVATFQAQRLVDDARYAERFLLGSDTWINERWFSYDTIFLEYRNWLAQLPRDQAAKIAHGNAERLFGPRPTN